MQNSNYNDLRDFESHKKTNQITSLIFGACTIFGAILYLILRTIDAGYTPGNVVVLSGIMAFFAMMPYALSKFRVRQSFIKYVNAFIFSSTYTILILGDREASDLTIWSSVFVLIILSLLYSDRTVLTIVSITSLSLFVFIAFQEPEKTVLLNNADYLGRIGILFLVIIVAYYVNYLLRKRTFDIEKKLNEMSLQRDEIEALYQEITATEEELRDKLKILKD